MQVAVSASKVLVRESTDTTNDSKASPFLIACNDFIKESTHLFKNINLLKKLDMYKYFEYVAGSDTFSFNKPDPRHLTDVVEIIGGDLKKTIMVGDSEVDANSAHNANLPFVLVKDGYTEKTEKEIKHDELINDFIGFDKIIEKYLW